MEGTLKRERPARPAPAPEGRRPPFSEAGQKECEHILSRYPVKKAAMLPLLHLAEREFGIITEEVMAYLAKILDVPPSKVMGVYTFYTWYRRAGSGKYLFQVCCTLPCALRGSDHVVAYLEQKLGIKVGETTPDGRFTLRKVECLGSCDTAPVIQINEDYHENLTRADVDRLLNELSRDA